MVVYFIQRSSDGAIKIGYTSCLNNRKNQIKCGLKSDVKILCVIDGGRQTEQMAHKQFNKLHIEGEWFLPGEELLEYLDAMQNNSLDIKTVLKERRLHGIVVSAPRKNILWTLDESEHRRLNKERQEEKLTWDEFLRTRTGLGNTPKSG